MALLLSSDAYADLKSRLGGGEQYFPAWFMAMFHYMVYDSVYGLHQLIFD